VPEQIVLSKSDEEITILGTESEGAIKGKEGLLQGAAEKEATTVVESPSAGTEFKV
jgi:hypothetical protein